MVIMIKNIPILYLLKAPVNQRFSDISGGITREHYSGQKWVNYVLVSHVTVMSVAAIYLIKFHRLRYMCTSERQIFRSGTHIFKKKLRQLLLFLRILFEKLLKRAPHFYLSQRQIL